MALSEIQTLIELLRYRAQVMPGQVAYTFENKPCTFGEMWHAVNRFAGTRLQEGVTKGERILLAIPNGPDFFTAFYGIQAAGAVPVPIYPESGPERIEAMKRLTGATQVYHAVEDPPGGFDPKPEDLPRISADDLAFLQYTSGSTGNPKGVQLTHRMLLTNVRQMIAGMEIRPDDIFVSWLPCFHDMGLILMTMAPFYLAAPLHLLPTSLRALTVWLNAIEQHKGTFTAAPDFAYRLLIRKAPDLPTFDLSTLRVALNAAEPVRAQTIADFHTTFSLQNVMVAGYGLAEATVGVSMWPPGTENKVDAHGFVSVGPPFPGVDILIVDENRRVPAGVVGEVLVKSPANTPGYFKNPAETQRLFWEDGSIHTGDLGYLDPDGILTIVARTKNLIKHAGRSIAPREVEEIIDQIPEIRIAAAIGVDRGRIEGEQIYVFAELRAGGKEMQHAHPKLVVKMVASIQTQLGLRPARVFLLKPGSIPLTYNGKIQYGVLKSDYLDGALRTSGKIIFPDY